MTASADVSCRPYHDLPSFPPTHCSRVLSFIPQSTLDSRRVPVQWDGWARGCYVESGQDNPLLRSQ